MPRPSHLHLWKALLGAGGARSALEQFEEMPEEDQQRLIKAQPVFDAFMLQVVGPAAAFRSCVQ